jgi:hypothetical protein
MISGGFTKHLDVHRSVYLRPPGPSSALLSVPNCESHSDLDAADASYVIHRSLDAVPAVDRLGLRCHGQRCLAVDLSARFQYLLPRGPGLRDKLHHQQLFLVSLSHHYRAAISSARVFRQLRLPHDDTDGHASELPSIWPLHRSNDCMLGPCARSSGYQMDCLAAIHRMLNHGTNDQAALLRGCSSWHRRRPVLLIPRAPDHAQPSISQLVRSAKFKKIAPNSITSLLLSQWKQ